MAGSASALITDWRSCPVVSTDCPNGTSEVLKDGEFGRLVLIGDVEALVTAIEATLEALPLRDRLVERARPISWRVGWRATKPRPLRATRRGGLSPGSFRFPPIRIPFGLNSWP